MIKRKKNISNIVINFDYLNKRNVKCKCWDKLIKINVSLFFWSNI